MTIQNGRFLRAAVPHRLVFAGEALVDVVMRVPALPDRGGDVLAAAAEVTVGGGFNVMAAAARQGLPVLYAGGHGTGPWGDMVRAALAAEGISVLRSPDADRDTGFDVALVEPDGERTFVTRLGAEMVRGPRSWDAVPAEPGDAVYVSGYGLAAPETGAALSAWAASLAPGVLLYVDPGPLVAHIPAALLDPVLARCDWLSCNQREAALLTHEELPHPGLTTAKPADPESSRAKPGGLTPDSTPQPRSSANPANPALPVDPAAPTTPTPPANPPGPAAPTDSIAPANPPSPIAPTTPTTPANPVGPTTPATSTTSANPPEPAAPTTPTAPANPVGPAAPATPATSAGPPGPTAPADPAGPTAPATPTAPADLPGPAAPADSSAPAGGVADLAGAARRLLSRTGRAGVIVRAGAAGCFVATASADGPVHASAPAVSAVDTTGAGDAHSGVFLAALAEGLPPPVAAARANAAAALAVTRQGPATAPTRTELDTWLSGG